MTAVAEHVVVTAPGVYDMPDEIYHGDPVPGGSLSASGAKLLLDCPAKFQYDRTHPRAEKRTFDIGKAAHKVVLGSGPDLVVVDAPDWRTKAAQEAKRAAYAEGAVPLLPHEHDEITAMAVALAQHPVASALFRPGTGRAEQSLFWRDPVTGVMRRARLDWLPDNLSSAGRLVIPDYKTCDRADLDSIQRAIHKYRYYVQAATYIDGAEQLVAEYAAFVFVFQEKTAPYLVTVVQLDELALRLGRDLNRQALDTYARCVRTGEWPGYASDIETVRLPAWLERQVDDTWQ